MPFEWRVDKLYFISRYLYFKRTLYFKVKNKILNLQG